jgi:hypothetical protein
VIPLKVAIRMEQSNWERLYRQFEQPLPLTRKQKAARQVHREFWVEFEKRFGHKPCEPGDDD